MFVVLHLTFYQVPADKPLLYNFHVSRWKLYHTTLYTTACLLTATWRLTLNPEANMDALFYPETIMQTTMLVNRQHILLTSQGSKKYADCMNNMFLYIILPHLQ